MKDKPKFTSLPSGGKLPGAGEKKTPKDFYDEITLDVLARTLWGEARGEGTAGMQAVACVIINRVKIAQARNKFWWGNDIIQVCQKPYQFSCWNRSDPNYKKLHSVNMDNPYFASATDIAYLAMIGELSDMTGGATHYHAKSISPYWIKGETPSADIGRHLFYKIENG